MKYLNKIIEWGIYLFVFLLPWQTRLIFKEGELNGYWEYGTAGVYGTEIVLWIVFLIWVSWVIVAKLKSQNSNLKAKIQSSKYFYLLLLGFIGYFLASCLWAESRNVALMAAFRLVEGIGLFLILRTFGFDWKKISWAFIFSALIQAGLGIYQFLAQATFASKWLGMPLHDPATLGTIVVETTSGRWLRAYGSLPHPNMLGGFLAMALFLIIVLYRKTEAPYKKYFLVSIFTILSLGLLTAFSKSAILAVAIVLVLSLIGSILFPVIKENRKILLKFICFFIFITVVFSLLFWQPVSTRIFGEGRLELKSSTERINYIAESWQIIKRHSLLGVGLGNYTFALHNEVNPNLNSWEYQPVHNIYLLILAELGVLGFLAFLLILLWSFVTLQNNNNWYNLFDLENIGILLVLIIGLFDHYFWTLYFGIILFWVCLACSAKRVNDNLKIKI